MRNTYFYLLLYTLIFVALPLFATSSAPQRTLLNNDAQGNTIHIQYRSPLYSANNAILMTDYDNRIYYRDDVQQVLTELSYEQAANGNVSVLHLIDTNTVTFLSDATNLVSGVSDYLSHLYFFDRNTQTMSVLKNTQGIKINGNIYQYWPTEDGETLYFTSNATNILDGINGEVNRLYAYERATKTFSSLLEDYERLRVRMISNDGNSILFSAYTYDSGDDYYVYHRQQQSLMQLGSVYEIKNVKMSGDGNYIYYNDVKGQLLQIKKGSDTRTKITVDTTIEYIVDVDTTGEKLILRNKVGDLSGLGEQYWVFDVKTKQLIMLNEKSYSHQPYRFETIKFAQDNTKLVARIYNSAYIEAITYAELASQPIVKFDSNPTATSNLNGQIKLSIPVTATNRYRVHVYESATPEHKIFYTNTVFNELPYEPKTDAPVTFEVASCNLSFVCDTPIAIEGQAIVPEQVTNVSLHKLDKSRLQVRWGAIANATSYNVKVINANGGIDEHFARFNELSLYHSNTNTKFIKVQTCAYKLCSDFSEWFELDSEEFSITDVAVKFNDSATQATLTWQADKASYFKVFSSNYDSSTSQFRVKTQQSQFIDSNFDKHHNNVYTIVAYDESDQEIDRVSENVNLRSGERSISINQYIEPGRIRIISNYAARSYSHVNLYRRESRFSTDSLIASSNGNNDVEFDDGEFDPEHNSYYYTLEFCIGDSCIRSNTVEVVVDHYFHTNKLTLGVSKGLYTSAVALTWSSPNTPIERYKIFRNGSAVATLAPTKSQYFDTQLVPDTEYQYRVQAVFYNGRTISSRLMTGYASLVRGVADINEAPQLTDISYRSFDNISFEVSDRPVNARQLKVYTLNDAGQYVFSRNTSGTVIDFNYLQANTALTVKAQWCNTVLCGPMSEPVTGYTSNSNKKPEVAPLGLDYLIRPTYDNVEVELTWQQESGADFYKVGRRYSAHTYYFSEIGDTTNPVLTVNQSYESNYHYAVKSCNASGCSPWSEELTITVDKRPNAFIPYLASISSIGRASGHIKGIIFNINRYWGLQNVQHHIYMSQSVDGEKTKIANDISGRVFYELPSVDVRYYFWVESCFSENECKLNPYYRTFKIEQIETIPIPDVIASNNEYVNSIVLTRKSVFDETRLKVYQKRQGDAEYQIQNAFTGNRTTLVDPIDNYYDEEVVDYQVELCDKYTNLCSERAALTGSAAPNVATEFNGSKLYSADYRDSYNNRMETHYSKFRGKEDVLRFEQFSSAQQLYYGEGFIYRFNLYVPRKDVYNQLSNCNVLFDLNFGFDNSNQTVHEMSMLKIFHPTQTCTTTNAKSNRINLQWYDGEVSTLNAIKFDRWQQVVVKKPENSEQVKLFIDGELIAQTSFRSKLDNEFAKLKLKSDGALFQGVNFSSLGTLNKNRPRPLDFFVSATSSGSYISFRNLINNSDVDAIHLVVSDLSNQIITEETISVASIADDNYTLQLSELNSGQVYIAGIKFCKQNLCSPVYADIFNAQSNLQKVEDINVNPGANIGEVALSWDAVQNATRYEIFVSEQIHGNKIPIGESFNNAFTATNLVNGWYFYVKTCREQVCGPISNGRFAVPNLDSDNDGLTDNYELSIGTDPFSSDTDGDGLSDKWELDNGTSPTLTDTDGDGLNDGDEINAGTSPANIDSDGDGISDYHEIVNKITTKAAAWKDVDKDGLPMLLELQEGLDESAKDNNVFASHRQLILQAYVDTQYVFVDELTMSTQLTELNNKSLNPALLYSNLLDDANLAQMGFIGRVYKAVMMRSADVGGAEYYRYRLNTGLSPLAMVTGFVNSTEFQNRYGALSNGEFVELVYRNVMNRAADSAGYDYWVERLESGRATRAELMLSFLNSNEYVGRIDKLERMRVLSLLITRFQYTEDALGEFVTRVDAEQSTYSVMRELLASDGFKTRVMTGLTPAINDTDGDGVIDGIEFIDGSNPEIKDNDVDTDDTAFVKQSYRDLLSEQWSLTQVATDVATLATVTRSQWLDGLMNSDNYVNNHTSVARLFFSTFLRRPDFNGLNFWQGKFNTGMKITDIANVFASSNEFQTRYGSLSDSDFIDLVYQNVLARNIDAGGKQFWLGKLQNGMSRGELLSGLSDSTEGKGKAQSKVNSVLLYNGLLKRDPTNTEYSNAKTQLDSNDRSGLITTLINMQEYSLRFN